ncbi:hypothetical protein KIPB_001257 [Kipferlia bialata]|uniref:Uncharacterized protein n=1 Tax=Kipferlia bialata TaxID=797122 RepID=A0A9K3CQF1_9EUKA|nr:hypothetical protein KIPB_001257 [Kipferlia bialata]|eukprot:g1257.t1
MYRKARMAEMAKANPGSDPKENKKEIAQYYKTIDTAELEPYVDMFNEAKAAFRKSVTEFYIAHPEYKTKEYLQKSAPLTEVRGQYRGRDGKRQKEKEVKEENRRQRRLRERQEAAAAKEAEARAAHEANLLR